MQGLLALPCCKLSRHQRISIVCRDARRGFNTKKDSSMPEIRKNSMLPGNQNVDDIQFEKRLQELRASGIEQKRIKEEKKFGPIEYDSSGTAGSDTGKKDNLLLKIGAAVALLGLVVSFTLGDYFPTGSPTVQNPEVVKTVGPEEESKLKEQLGKFEEELKSSPDDPTALEGAGVIYAELGQYKDAQDNLEKLTQISSKDVEAWRLLGEVKSALKDYEGSAAAYREAMKASSTDSMLLLRGFVQALIDAKKPSVAVDELLNAKGKLKDALQVKITKVDEPKVDETQKEADTLDPVQIDLLLGKSYSAWDHLVDALAVYDGLIKSFPDDFRGYLAKGVLLRDQGRRSEAERMFIQARYLAPSKAKFLVDKFAK